MRSLTDVYIDHLLVAVVGIPVSVVPVLPRPVNVDMNVRTMVVHRTDHQVRLDVHFFVIVRLHIRLAMVHPVLRSVISLIRMDLNPRIIPTIRPVNSITWIVAPGGCSAPRGTGTPRRNGSA